jgi:phenolic acid decarboxylase
MKIRFVTLLIALFVILSMSLSAQTASTTEGDKPHLFIDVHQLEPGKVKFEDVAQAHLKDLATQQKHGVRFLKFWVDESKGLVYCLSSATDTAAIRKTHAEAHGLLPNYIYGVTDGPEAAPKGNYEYFLDVHDLGPGKVTAKDVAEAHQKDLATQKKYGVNFINYWVDEKKGVVVCLSQAKDSTSIIQTHKEAHGLVPVYVMKVKEGE